MDNVLPIIQSVLGLVITGFLVPWLRKKNKLDGAQWIAVIAADALGRVVANNPGLKAAEVAKLLAEELRDKLKLSEAVAARAAAGAVLRAGLK